MLLQGHQCLTRRLTDCSSKTLQNCVLMFVCYSVGSRVWAVLELSRALQLQIFFLESLKLMRFLCPSIRMEEEEEEEVRDKGLFVALKISCA